MSGNKRFSEKEARFFLSYAMAAKLHEGWRETRQMRNSKGELFFEPYWKVTKDKVFIFTYLKHLKDGETNTKGNIRNSKGKLEIDIANLTFNELPRDLQAKNLASASMAIDLVYAPVIRSESTLPGGQSYGGYQSIVVKHVMSGQNDILRSKIKAKNLGISTNYK